MSSYYSIVGPTGSGKTGVVLQAAERLLQTEAANRVAMVSADSRQVYQGLEVVTGADIPIDFSPISVEFSPYTVYRHADLDITLFGSAITSPLAEWSAAHFAELLSSVLTEYDKPTDRVFVVGGTMLYHAILEHADRTLQPGRDARIREKAENLTVTELQNWLTSINKSALATMNQSDRHNARRLVRAIEKVLNTPATNSDILPISTAITSARHLWYGLLPEMDALATNISIRVAERFESGAKEEVIELRAQIEDMGLNPSKLPAWTSCGVPYLDAFLQGEITQAQCLEKWTAAELSYVKRQLTWWKKQTNITWFSEKDDLLNKLLHL